MIHDSVGCLPPHAGSTRLCLSVHACRASDQTEVRVGGWSASRVQLWLRMSVADCCACFLHRPPFSWTMVFCIHQKCMSQQAIRWQSLKYPHFHQCCMAKRNPITITYINSSGENIRDRSIFILTCLNINIDILYNATLLGDRLWDDLISHWITLFWYWTLIQSARFHSNKYQLYET